MIMHYEILYATNGSHRPKEYWLKLNNRRNTTLLLRAENQTSSTVAVCNHNQPQEQTNLTRYRRRRNPADSLSCGRSPAARNRPNSVLSVVRRVRVRRAVRHRHGIVVLAALVLHFGNV